MIATKENKSKRTPSAAVMAEQSSSNRVHHVDQNLAPSQITDLISNNSSVRIVGDIRSSKIERARYIARNLVSPEEQSESMIIYKDSHTFLADMRHDKIEEARFIAFGLQDWRKSQQQDLEQRQPAAVTAVATTTTTTTASPMQAARWPRLEAKLQVSEKPVNELEEVILACVNARVPVSLLQGHLNGDNDLKQPEHNNEESAGCYAVADDDRVLEKLLAFLKVKGDEYRKDPTTETTSKRSQSQRRQSVCHDGSCKDITNLTMTTSKRSKSQRRQSAMV
jgi:hypothetical protein